MVPKLPGYEIVKFEANVKLVLSDLEHCAISLSNEKNSPKEVRRLFREFVMLSQQVTEIMRKEFKAKTGSEWRANDFKGWDDVTALFKKLRREDFHETPAILGVHDVQTFKTSDLFGSAEDLGEIQWSGTWLMSNQNSVTVPDPQRVTVCDPASEDRKEVEVIPLDRQFSYRLLPRTEEISSALEKVGTSDVHALVHRCYAVLKEYGEFYGDRLTSRSWNS